MFQNGVINDPGFQQLAFQWQKALVWPCCCCCRPSANKSSQRLRVALRRVVENKGNMPPWGNELLENDDPPIRCHTPPNLREESEQRYLLTHDPFCDSPAVIDLANWIMDQEEDRVWAEFLAILQKPVSVDDAQNSWDGDIDEHESVSQSVPQRRPGFEFTRGGGDRSSSASASPGSGVVIAADEAKRIAALRMASMPRSAPGSGVDSVNSSVSSGRSNAPPMPSHLSRMRSNLGSSFRQAGGTQVGAMTTQVEANRAVREVELPSVNLARVTEFEDGETASLLGSVQAPSSVSYASQSAGRSRNDSAEVWDRRSETSYATTRVEPRRRTGPLYTPPDLNKLKELQEENLGLLRRPPLGLMTQEADELMDYAKISLEEDPENALQLMIKAQQKLYDSGVVRPTMVTLAEECLRQVGQPRIRPDMNNIEFLMTIRYEIDRRKYAKGPPIDKRRLGDKICDCLSQRVCCCGYPADDIERNSVPRMRLSPQEQIAAIQATMKQSSHGGSTQPRSSRGSPHAPSPSRGSQQSNSRYHEYDSRPTDLRAVQRDSPTRRPEPVQSFPTTTSRAAAPVHAANYVVPGAPRSPHAPPARAQSSTAGPQTTVLTSPPRPAPAPSATRDTRSVAPRLMTPDIRRSFPFNQMALSPTTEEPPTSKPISRRVLGPTGVVTGVEHAAAWLGGLDPDVRASSDSPSALDRPSGTLRDLPPVETAAPRLSGSLPVQGQAPKPPYHQNNAPGSTLPPGQPRPVPGHAVAAGAPARPAVTDPLGTLALARARLEQSPQRPGRPGPPQYARTASSKEPWDRESEASVAPSVHGGAAYGRKKNSPDSTDWDPDLDEVEVGEATVHREMDRKPPPHHSRLQKISSAEPLDALDHLSAMPSLPPQSRRPEASERPGPSRGSVRTRASALEPGTRARVPTPSNELPTGSASSYGHPIMPHDPMSRSQSSNGG